MVKKNYHGGLKLLLSLLFIMLLGMCSTCYANVSEDYVYYLLESCADYSVITSTNQTQVNNLKNFYKTPANVTATTNYINYQLNYNNLGNFNNYNLIALLNDTGSSSYIQIFFIFSNCGLNDVYDAGYLRHYPTYFNVMNTTNVPVGRTAQIYLRLTNTGYNFTQYFPTGTTSYNFNGQGYTIDGSIINVKNCFNYVPTQTVYDSSDVTKPLLLTDERGTFSNNRPTEPEPEEPSGDSPSGDSGDSGGNGGGFNDYTNQLNDINNNISSSSNNIIQNSNENTDKIINSISGETNKLINNITNTDTDVDPEEEFDNMLSSTANVVDPTVNFFSWLLDNMRTVLNSTGNYNIEVTLFDETYTIRSDFFVLPDGDLKTFLQLSFIGWFGWHVIKKIRYIVYAIQCVKITDALHQVDFNPDIL